MKVCHFILPLRPICLAATAGTWCGPSSSRKTCGLLSCAAWRSYHCRRWGQKSEILDVVRIVTCVELLRVVIGATKMFIVFRVIAGPTVACAQLLFCFSRRKRMTLAHTRQDGTVIREAGEELSTFKRALAVGDPMPRWG